jgi:hypothetical protein
MLPLCPWAAMLADVKGRPQPQTRPKHQYRGTQTHHGHEAAGSLLPVLARVAQGAKEVGVVFLCKK